MLLPRVRGTGGTSPQLRPPFPGCHFLTSVLNMGRFEVVDGMFKMLRAFATFTKQFF